MNVMKKLGLCLSMVAAVMGLQAPIAQAHHGGSGTGEPGNVVNERTEFVFVGLDSCNGEWLELAGTLHFVQNRTSHDGEVVHIQVHLTGTSSGGTEYVLNGHQNFKVTGTSFYTILREVLVSKGSAPNQILTLEFSFPPPSLSIDIECKG